MACLYRTLGGRSGGQKHYLNRYRQAVPLIVILLAAQPIESTERGDGGQTMGGSREEARWLLALTEEPGSAPLRKVAFSNRVVPPLYKLAVDFERLVQHRF